MGFIGCRVPFAPRLLLPAVVVHLGRVSSFLCALRETISTNQSDSGQDTTRHEREGRGPDWCAEDGRLLYRWTDPKLATIGLRLWEPCQAHGSSQSAYDWPLKYSCDTTVRPMNAALALTLGKDKTKNTTRYKSVGRKTQ